MTMVDHRLTDLLAAAIYNLETAMAKLNVGSHQCPTCMKRQYIDWPEYRGHEVLGSAVSKIKTARRLLGIEEE